MAQRPGSGPGAGGADDLVVRMMAFYQDKDGKLVKGEITDDRLLRLFDRADANKDGVVTREELAALYQKENDSGRAGSRERPQGPGSGPPGGRGGDPYQALDQANRRYLAAYRANSVIWALVEQVSTVDPEIHQIRLLGRRRHVERVARTIRRWQERGLAGT